MYVGMHWCGDRDIDTVFCTLFIVCTQFEHTTTYIIRIYYIYCLIIARRFLCHVIPTTMESVPTNYKL